MVMIRHGIYMYYKRYVNINVIKNYFICVFISIG